MFLLDIINSQVVKNIALPKAASYQRLAPPKVRNKLVDYSNVTAINQLHCGHTADRAYELTPSGEYRTPEGTAP